MTTLIHSAALNGPARTPLLRRISTALTLHRQRAQLARLESHQLADIGISKAEARRESERPAWDVPNNWRC